ncbi:beta-lactamase/transpeptidase-like protein [Aspergillus coremiiformis]|uniref:Beta-lactamase/transpeptidase-like protein n=1 Tax=Aspergillus coremiiformis TaxID=138285 RepID=A0A5N6Z2E3_9EURO|nr:beta-lactamase/transpeptidase-like protein [Aspergillus coremiiformis]
MTSSTVTYVGHISQSNYAASNAVLDNLSRQRIHMGLPAATISLGPIKGVGTLNRKPEYAEHLLPTGLIEAEESDGGGAVADATGDDLLMSDIPDDRDEAVIVLAQLMFIPVEEIHISRPFSHFGLDSMSGSELIHWLNQKFGERMSFFQLLAPSCTPKNLAGIIFDTVMKTKASSAEPAVPDAAANGTPHEKANGHNTNGVHAVRGAIADPKPVMHSYVCTVVNSKGEQLYSPSECTLSQDSSTPVDFDAVYGIASLSKVITTVAVMIYDDVSLILPDLCALPVLDGVDSEGRARTKPRTKTITLRSLMSHQSGCGYHPSPPLARWAKQNGKTNSVFDSDFQVMKTFPLLFEPGEGWMYGSGPDWAGEAIARINNATLEDFMRSNIWEPLGMNSTIFHPERHPGMMDRLITMYKRTDDHRLARGDWLSRIPASHDCGGHGLWSTPHDWTMFLRMVLADGGSILAKASIDENFLPQTIGSSDLQELLTGPLRASLRSTVDMGAGNVETALGGPLYMEAIAGKRSAGTLQWACRPNMFWWIDRTKGVAATTFTQVISQADARFEELTSQFEMAVYADFI